MCSKCSVEFFTANLWFHVQINANNKQFYILIFYISLDLKKKIIEY